LGGKHVEYAGERWYAAIDDAGTTSHPVLFVSHPDPFLRPLLRVIEDVSEMAATAILTVVHGGHEDTRTACLRRTLPPQALDLPVSVNLVVLEHRQLGLLALVLDLLWGGVDLLLPLLATTTKT
jgi:hypothetical protein